MRINNIYSAQPISVSNKNPHLQNFNYVSKNTNEQISDISSICYKPFVNKTHKPAAIITFTGAGRDKSEGIFVGAELPPYSKEGGVATVMKDYSGVHIMPYYNGKIKYDPETGEINEKSSVEVLKLPDGTPIYTKMDQDIVSYEDIVSKPSNYYKLEEVSKGTMEWGLNPEDHYTLYKIIPSEKDKEAAIKEYGKYYDNYMVYTDGTAIMRKAYDNTVGSYSFGLKDAPEDASKWTGDAYAKFDKATTCILKDVNSNAATVVCSDQQSAYIPHYMAQEYKKGNEFIKSIKPTYVMHNVGLGYTGSTSNVNMFVNLATTKQIELVRKDPDFQKALASGKIEEYFKPLLKNVTNDLGSPSAIMIPLRYREQEYVVAATTVAEEYGKSIAENPMVAPEIHETVKGLKEKNMWDGGILNPLNDKTVSAYLPLGLPGYGSDQEVEINGVKKIIPAFKVFTPEMTYDEMMKVKLENKKNLFNRLSGDYHQNTVITGSESKKATLLGHIDKKWMNNKDVKLFTSWGRGDFQKAHDSVIESWAKFAKTPEGENSVLVLGGVLDEANPESAVIRDIVTKCLNDEKLAGRLCFMDGFAPGYALASAADASILPSRFAPCELTDFESKKYFCCTITANTQGLKQKNFDPRIAEEAEVADGYRTTHEYQMGHDELCNASPDFKTDYEKLLKDEKLKLKNRGVNADSIDTLADKHVMKSKGYQKIYRKYADSIMVDELAQNLNAFMHRPAELCDRMYQNHIKLKTGWDDNEALHPSKETSRQMYKKMHFDRDAKAPNELLFNFDTAIEERVKYAELSSSSGNIDMGELKTAIKEGIDDAIKKNNLNKKSLFELSKSVKIGIVAASTLAAAGAIYASFSHKKTKEAETKVENLTDRIYKKSNEPVEQIVTVQNSDSNKKLNLQR